MPHKTVIARFDSPEEYRDYLAPLHNTVWHARDQFLGVYSWDKAMDCLLNGDTANLARAEKIIDQLSDERIFSEGLPVYMPAMAGSFPNVPASIMGHPMDMFAKQSLEMDNVLAPLTIYVEATVSAGLSHDELTARGVSILAFALAMNNIRPVEVWAVSSNIPSGKHIGGVIAVKIASAPMDIKRAVYMLTDPSYCRRLAFAATCKATGAPDRRGMSWLWDLEPQSQEYQTKFRALMEMQPQDIFITGGYLTDKLMLKNPTQWVKNMIAQHGGTKDE